MASSELVLAPQVDRNALKRSEMQIAQSMENAGKKASIEMRKDLKREVSNGLNQGVKDGVSKSRGNMKALGLGVAAAAAMVIADTMDKTLGSLEDNIDRIMGKLDTIREVSENAKAFGIDEGRYAAISVLGSAKGLDQSDMQGIFAGFAASLQDDEMKGFKGIRDTQGMEKAFFDFLSSTAKLTGSDRENQLIKVFGEDDMRLVSRIMGPMAAMQSSGQPMNLESLYKNVTGRDLQLAAMQQGISRSQTAQGMITAQQAQFLENTFIKGVTPGQASAVTSVASSQKNLEAAQMTALNLQVKAKILADQLEVKQIQAGTIMGDFMFDFFKNEIDLAKGDVGWMEYIKQGFKTSPMANAIKSKEGQEFLTSLPQSPMRMAEQEVSDAFSAMFELIGNKLDAINNSLSNNNHEKY